MLEHYHHPKKKPLPLISQSLFPPSPIPWQTLSASMVCPILVISCEWNPTKRGLSCLVSFTWHGFQVRSWCSPYQDFISFCGGTMFCRPDAPLLFVHLSADGHLGHSHVGGIIEAAVNIHVEFLW